VTPAEALSQAIQATGWLLPAAGIAHLWSILLVAGAAILFDLRVLGLGQAAAVRTIARQLLPWSLVGLVVAVPAGLILVAGRPEEILAHPAFPLKMGLLSLIALNAIAFHFGPSSAALAPDARSVPALARVQALVSLCLWLAVLACARALVHA
jgi:hypothetical protein